MAENPTWQCVVAAALRDGEGRWLMHRRPEHKQHGGLWEFPGGKVDPGESPAQALVREVREELGVAVDSAAMMPLTFAEEGEVEGRPRIVILLYSVARWEGDLRALEEGAAINWFTPAAIADLDRPPLDRELCAQIMSV